MSTVILVHLAVTGCLLVLLGAVTLIQALLAFGRRAGRHQPARAARQRLPAPAVSAAGREVARHEAA